MIIENQIEIAEAIGQVFDYCIANNHDDFVLYLAHPEYQSNWFSTGKSMVLMDSSIDALKDESREKFYIRYLRRNYNKEGFCYDGEEGVDDLHIELMIYTHIWESTYFFKQLYRLANIVQGNGYVWNVDPRLSRHKVITKSIIPFFRDKNLKLGDLVEKAYSSYLRDSFAHSEYTIDESAKKIYLFNTSRNKADKGNNIVSWSEFQQKFMKSIQLCYWLNHCILLTRLNFAKANVVTHLLIIPDGRKIQVLAKMQNQETARFEGVIIKNG